MFPDDAQKKKKATIKHESASIEWMQEGNQTSSSSVSNSICDARVRARVMSASSPAHGVGDIISNMLYFPLRITSSCDSILQSVGHLVRRYLTHRNMEDIIMIPRALE